MTQTLYAHMNKIKIFKKKVVCPLLSHAPPAPLSAAILSRVSMIAYSLYTLRF
jgi:hypothetical protein